MIKGLAREVSRRMENVGVKGSKITLKIMQQKPGAPPPPKFLGHGSCYHLSKSCDTPNNAPTCQCEIMARIGMELFVQMSVAAEDVRGMGIVVSKLVTSGGSGSATENKNRSIRSWFSETPRFGTYGEDSNSFSLAKTQEYECNVNGLTDRSPKENEAITKQQHLKHDIIDLSASITDEMLPSATFATNASTNPVNPFVNDDIALPPLSQIHMSQVVALPSPLRRQAIAKINEERRRSEHEIESEFEVQPARDARFRQTNVKRMLRLASVKAHRDISIEGISFTQFEQLPLEVQLQVANKDEMLVGRLSPQADPGRGRDKIPRALTTATAKRAGCPCLKKSASSERTEEPFDFTFEDNSHDFFCENTYPLMTFLDENPMADQDAAGQVIEFLLLCVQENRLNDVVTLLRSINNRCDQWSGEMLDSILKSINNTVKASRGVEIDKDWLIKGTM